MANLIKSIFDSESNYYKAPESDFSGFTASSNITRTPPQTVMIDWGTEFEDPFRSWARRKSIKLRRSCPCFCE